MRAWARATIPAVGIVLSLAWLACAPSAREAPIRDVENLLALEHRLAARGLRYAVTDEAAHFDPEAAHFDPEGAHFDRRAPCSTQTKRSG